MSEKVEFLGKGQQCIAYGDHPDTGEPYRYINKRAGAEPLCTKLEDLPPSRRP